MPQLDPLRKGCQPRSIIVSLIPGHVAQVRKTRMLSSLIGPQAGLSLNNSYIERRERTLPIFTTPPPQP